MRVGCSAVEGVEAVVSASRADRHQSLLDSRNEYKSRLRAALCSRLRLKNRGEPYEPS